MFTPCYMLQLPVEKMEVLGNSVLLMILSLINVLSGFGLK